jgi:hypothetical protein
MTSSCRKFKRQGLGKNNTELILDNALEATDIRSDETHGKEDDVTQQAPALPHQGVYKQILY